MNRTVRLIYCMKKILVLSAVLFGAITASQAGVPPGIGFGLRLPFLPRLAIRAPLPPIPIPTPAVVCEAPRLVYAPAVPVCPPTPVVRLAVPTPCPPGPVFHGEVRGWHGYPGTGWGHGNWHGRR